MEAKAMAIEFNDLVDTISVNTYAHTHIYIYITNCFFQNKLRIIIRGYPFKICAQLNLAHAEAPGDKGDAAIGQITGHAMAPLIAADVLSGHGRVTLRYTENK